MFSWRRHETLPLEEPSEQAIWAEIDRHDTRGTANVQDRLEQHTDMLRGRDLYRGFFTRSSMLPDLSSIPLTIEEPADWVSVVKLKCGEYNPLEKAVDQLSHGFCDILQPASDILEKKGESRLLAHRNLQSGTSDRSRNLSVGQTIELPCGYITWGKYILQAHKNVLKVAGVYEAVYASLFSFKDIPSSWAQGVVEFWDPSTNTCWIGAEELTVTLWDLHMISGLPIYGHCYEECIPSDEVLFGRRPSDDGNNRGQLVMPSTFMDLLDRYQATFTAVESARRSKATLSTRLWILSFLQEQAISDEAISLQDPFNQGIMDDDYLTEETAEPIIQIGSTSPALPGLSEDLFLAAFIATWLCIVVFPLSGGSIRPSVFLVASRIARGERFSLAPAVLARIYRILRVASETGLVVSRDLTLPWQYVYGWVHLHIQGAFSCFPCPSYFMTRGFPAVLQLYRATSTLEMERIRLFFFAPYLVGDRFRLVHQTCTASLSSDLIGVDLTDSVDEHGRYSLLQTWSLLKAAEYFFGMRPGWLCYRFGESLVVEGYQPNRVARQFGLSQCSARDGRPVLPWNVDFQKIRAFPVDIRYQTAVFTWRHLLRIGTGSSFRITPANSYTGVSYTHLTWVKISYGPFLERGVRKYERKVRSLASRRLRLTRDSSSGGTTHIL